MSSTRQNPAEQAKALASQLKCPMGDTGQELAHSFKPGESSHDCERPECIRH